MEFERRMLDIVLGVGDVASRVPAWAWWSLLALAVISFVLSAAISRWRLLVLLIRTIDRVNEVVGRVTAWIMLFLVLITFTSVILRYAFATGWVWMADLIQWPHGAAFMLAAGYTMLHQGHVRVDIFYGTATRRQQAWTDLLGSIVFLLPWVVYVAWIMFPAVAFSWKFMESSANPGGLPGRYLLKSSVVLFSILLGAQGVAMAARSLLVLIGRDDLMEDASQQAP